MLKLNFKNSLLIQDSNLHSLEVKSKTFDEIEVFLKIKSNSGNFKINKKDDFTTSSMISDIYFDLTLNDNIFIDENFDVTLVSLTEKNESVVFIIEGVNDGVGNFTISAKKKGLDFPKYYTNLIGVTLNLGDVYFDGTNYFFYDGVDLQQITEEDAKSGYAIGETMIELGYISSYPFFSEDVKVQTKIGYDNYFINDISNVINLPIKEYEEFDSVALLRTNPRLTGNFKISTNGDDVFLNSIETNKSLEQKRFKDFKVTGGNLQSDLYKFLHGSGISSDLFFDVKKPINSIGGDINEQFETIYHSNVKHLKSTKVEDKMVYFAPLFLKKRIPDYFIICSVKHSINLDGGIIKNSKIIKTFDLSKESVIGKYIRTITNSPNFAPEPLNVNFDSGISKWNGVSLNDGILSSKVEDISEFLKSEKNIKDFDRYFTNGFMRNNISNVNILNLEFYFSDEQSEDFEINRYFGFYVSKTELENFNIDFENINIENQTPIIPINSVYEYTDTEISLNNNEFVKIPFKGDILLKEQYLNGKRFIVTESKNKEFSRITNIINDSLFKTDKKKLKISDFFGINDLEKQFEYKPNNEKFYRFNIELVNKLKPNEILTIINGDIRYSIIANDLLDSGEFWETNSISKKEYKKPFSNIGEYSMVSKTIVEAFNSFGVADFMVRMNGNKIEFLSKQQLKFNHTNVIGSNLNSLKYNNSKNTEFIKYNSIGNIELVLTEFNEFMDIFKVKYISTNSYVLIKIFKNGELIGSFQDVLPVSEFNVEINGVLLKVQPLVNLDIEYKFLPKIIEIEKEFIFGSGFQYLIKTNLIKDVSDSLWFQTKSKRYIQLNNYNTSSEKIISYQFDDVYSIFEFNEELLVSNNYISAYSTFQPKLSVLNFYETHDLDFDFFSNENDYRHLTELNYYFDDLIGKNLKPNTIENLGQNQFYQISMDDGDDVYFQKKGVISENIKLSNGDFFNTMNIDSSFSIFSLDIHDVSNNVFIKKILFKQDIDLKQFNGFNGIQRRLNEFETNKFQELINDGEFERFIYTLSKNEYEILFENSKNEDSLLIPYISKFVKTDSINSKNSEYRLNNSISFGIDNFSSNVEITTSNISNYSLEFTNFDSLPNYFTEDDLINNFNNPTRISDIINGSTWEDNFNNTEINYFLKYFSFGEPNLKKNDEKLSIRNRKVFSTIRYDNVLMSSSTFFKGVGIEFDDINGDLDGYKFSIILSNTNDDFKIDKKVIKNDTFKFIVILIKVKITDYKSKNWLDLVSFYATNSNISDININSKNEFSFSPILEYADITLNDIFYLSTLTYTQNNISGGFEIIQKLFSEKKNFEKYSTYTENLDSINLEIFNKPILIIDNEKLFNIIADVEYLDGSDLYTRKVEFGENIISKEVINFTSTSLPSFVKVCDMTGSTVKFDNIISSNINSNISIVNGGKNFNSYLKDFTPNNILNNLSFEYGFKLIKPKSLILNSKKQTLIDRNGEYYDIDINEDYTLNRYSGTYTIKTTPIIDYNIREFNDISNLYGIDFLNGNTVFRDDNYLLRNLISRKTSKGVISSKEKFYWVDDFEVFKTSWDDKYFKSLDNKKNLIESTICENVKDVNQFQGNKLINLPNTLIGKLMDGCFVINEENDTLIIKKDFVFINNIFNSVLSNEFKYLSDNNITPFSDINSNDSESFINEYIKENILKLYKIINIDVFKKTANTNKINFNELGLIVNSGFIRDKNINIFESNNEMVISLNNKNKFEYAVFITFKRI